MTAPEGIRLAVIFTQHDRKKYPRSLLRLIGVLSELPTRETTIVVVDNARDGDWSHAVSDCLFHIGGDNSAWEFSAFERGLDWLGGREADLYLFATDALLAYGEEFLDLVDGEVLEASVELGACVGWIDSFMERCQILDFSYDSWIRTSLIFIPREVLWRIRPLAWPIRPETIFGSGLDQPFQEDVSISPNLQRLLLEWLTQNVVEEQRLEETWHSRFDLAPNTFKLFQDKVMAILREHLLSARLHALGTPCFDYRAIRKAGGRDAIDALRGEGGRDWQWLGWMQMGVMSPDPQVADGPTREAPTLTLFASDETAEAAITVCQNVLPLILQRHGRTRLLVFGERVPAAIRALHGHDSVLVAEDGEEPGERLDHSSAFLALHNGFGVDQAAAHRVPVVAPTDALPAGWETGVHCLAADDPFQIAEACCRLIEEPELASALIEAARSHQPLEAVS